MAEIILSTLNARYIHSSLGLRYLKANMGLLENTTEINEFVINQRPIDVAETLLEKNPRIIGFGVYIWNVEQTTRVISLIKTISPETLIVLGGPEVSFEHEQQAICDMADYIITGQADLAFSELCDDIIHKEKNHPKITHANPVPLPYLTLPYSLYTQEDIDNRVIYVEASRGCPFKCEFCLSSLDKTAWPFDLSLFLSEMDVLYQRGVRDFKFIDRTFNLKISSSIKILEFFLEKNDPSIYLHFELIPDHLPEKLKDILIKFPDGCLQFEIGVQTFNPDVQSLISRKQDNKKTIDNIRWLRENANAHLHTDLIMGLPGETIESIGKSFDALVSLKPHEIQMGILKRLRGTPMIRHTDEYDMRYNPDSPYNILSNSHITFSDMQRLSRFARFWDIIANSGRFTYSLPVILGNSKFENFLKLSDELYSTSKQTHKIALPRLFELLHDLMIDCLKLKKNTVIESLWKDFQISGLKGNPSFATLEMIKQRKHATSSSIGDMPSRQSRHATKLH